MWTFRIIILTSIQADQTNKVVDHFGEDNTWLLNQVADLTNDLRSTVAPKAMYT